MATNWTRIVRRVPRARDKVRVKIPCPSTAAGVPVYLRYEMLLFFAINVNRNLPFLYFTVHCLTLSLQTREKKQIGLY